MATSPTDVAQRLRAQAVLDETEARARARALQAKLGDAARLLASAGASHVWVFGSLESGRAHAESDVDLAASGLPSARYFDVLSELMQLFGTRVDLVRLEDAPPSLRDLVVQSGRAL